MGSSDPPHRSESDDRICFDNLRRRASEPCRRCLRFLGPADHPLHSERSSQNKRDNRDGLIYSYYVPTGGYAANGNILAYSGSVMGDWAYTYDTLNRLSTAVAVVGPYAGQYGCWGYDSCGNRELESLQTSPCSTNWTVSVRPSPLDL